MGFTLKTFPVPDGLRDLGTVVEFRELPYGRVRDLLSKEGRLSGNEYLVAETLYIDGEPLGADRMENELPGHYFAHMPEAVQILNRAYGLDRKAPPAAADQASDPAQETERGNA